MKRRRIEKPVQPRPAAPAVPATLLERLPGWAVPAMLGVLLYFGMFLPSQTMSMVMVAAALVLVLVFRKGAAANLRKRLSIPVVALLFFILWNGGAAIYAPTGWFAADEFVKLLAAFPLAMLALLLTDEKHLRAVFWVFAGICAFFALLCVDGAGLGWLYGAFEAVMDALGSAFASNEQTVGASRINGIYNAANVDAGLLALGGLVTVWLARTGEKKWERPLGCFFMGLNAMGFFLSMSRAAILCFGVAMVAYVVASAREERLSLALFLFETVVVTVALSAVAMGFLGKDGSFIPDLMTLLCGPVVYAVDRFLGAPLAKRLQGHGGRIALACGAVAALAVVYAVAALNVTGAYRFTSGQRLYRTVELAPGSYIVEADAEGALRLQVIATVSETATRHQDESLYNGPLEEVAFTVPEDAISVSISVYGETGDRLNSLTLSDGTDVPLNYPLLPSFVADRLHEGLLSGTSFTLRLQYVKDGLKLFARRPLTGYGVGGTQGWLAAVMPFFYESKYLHNQVVQVMAELGLPGLLAWLGLMLGAAWLLLRRLRQEREPLAAMLLACWLMMNLHSLMEFSFSLRFYQCAVYFLLALILVAYPQPLPEKALRYGATGGVAFAAAWLVFFGASYGMYAMAQDEADTKVYETNAEIMQGTARLAKMDLYDPEQQRINYMANAVILNDSRYMARANKYAKLLRDSGVYSACTAVGKYYYLPKQNFPEVFACSREGLMNMPANRDAWNLQYIYYFEEVLPYVGPENFAQFKEGVEATRALLAEYEEGRLEKIDIAVLAQTYLDAFDEVKDLPDEEAFVQLLLTVQENQ